MTTAANHAIARWAVFPLSFLVLGMSLWDKPFGRRVFRTTPEFAAASKALAAHQGLYNGFLAAGLVWGLALGAPGVDVKVFFLACAVVAGLFGGATVNRNLMFGQ